MPVQPGTFGFLTTPAIKTEIKLFRYMCDLFKNAIDSLNLYIGFLSFTIAVSHALVKKKQPLNYVIIGIYLCYSFIIISYSLEVSGKMLEYPHLVGVSWPFHAFVAAAFFLYLNVLKTPTLEFSRKHLLYFLPGMVYFLCLVPTVYMKSVAEKTLLLMEYDDFNIVSLLNLIFFNTIIAVFSILSINEVRLILNRETLKRHKTFRVVFVLHLIAIIGVVLNCIALIMESDWLLRIDSMVFNVALFTPYFLSYRYPDFMYNLYVDFSQEKYKQSQLKGLDVESVLSRLNFLIKIEKVFTDPELNIGKLSQKLQITSHQLSEILNKNLQVTYSSFIANHRIQESKLHLVNNPNDTILKIAYAVGFNSKTAFNTAFKKITSLTPSEYRKENL